MHCIASTAFVYPTDASIEEGVQTTNLAGLRAGFVISSIETIVGTTLCQNALGRVVRASEITFPPSASVALPMQQDHIHLTAWLPYKSPLATKEAKTGLVTALASSLAMLSRKRLLVYRMVPVSPSPRTPFSTSVLEASFPSVCSRVGHGGAYQSTSPQSPDVRNS
jgi:hypothetical protein